MTHFLHKLSMPGWVKEFENKEDVVDELRKHICDGCLNPDLEDEDNWWAVPVDVEYEGVFYECRDISTLLSTPCGCEYDVTEGDEKLEDHYRIVEE